MYDFDCPNAMPRYYMDKLYNDGERRYIQHKRMVYSLQNPVNDTSLAVDHERLLKKLNRKNK